MNLKAGYPFSLIQNGLVANYPKLEHNIHSDVVIMGGGISGALTAWHLIKRNIKCVVVDARSIGLGSTCASTSLLQYEIDVPLHQLVRQIGRDKAVRAYRQSYASVKKILALAAGIGFESIRKKESLYFAANKKDSRAVKEEFEARKKAGFAVSFLSGKELFTETGLKAPAAILSTRAAEADAYLLTHALLQDSIKKGLEVYDRSLVKKLDHRKRHVEMITENGVRIKAKKLVYATGYEAVEVIERGLVKLRSTYATVSEAHNDGFRSWPKERLLWNTADPYLYLRTTPDNRIMIGGRDEDFYSPIKRDKLIGSKTRQLAQDYRKLFKGKEFIPEFSWTGVFGSTVDGLPYIGPYKNLANSYFALGFGGNGITFSLVAAEMIADLIEGKKNRDLSIFSFDR